MLKTTGFAFVVALALSGCGGGDVRPAATGADAPAGSTEASADLWAVQAYGIYGLDAVERCLAAFHEEFNKNNGAASAYRSDVAAFLCSCAKGDSPLPCP